METLLTQRGVVTLWLVLLGETIISDFWDEVRGQAQLQTIARDHLGWGIVISIIARRGLLVVILTALRYLRFFGFCFFLE